MLLNYIDPGSGSMIFQFLLASIIGVLTFFKNIKLFVLSIFRKKRENNEKEINDRKGV